MTQKHPDILRAERLRVITSMPEYGATIGAWIQEAYKASLFLLESAVEPHEVHRAQGAHRAVKGITEQIERAFLAEKAAFEKQHKKGPKA